MNDSLNKILNINGTCGEYIYINPLQLCINKKASFVLHLSYIFVFCFDLYFLKRDKEHGDGKKKRKYNKLAT